MADTWTLLNGYSVSEYVDTQVFEVDSATKKIRPISGQPLVAGEKNSQYIRFEMDRYWDGIDVSAKEIGITYFLAGTYYGTSEAVSAEVTDSRLRFGWIVPEEACCVSGTLLFVLVLQGTDYILKTQIAETPVVKTIDEDTVIPEPTKEAWYKTFREQVQADLNASQEALETAQSAVRTANSANAEAQEAMVVVNNAVEEAKIRYGSPLVANAGPEMVETNRVYVFTGSESAYTYGHWYYYDNGVWNDGGVYNGNGVNTDKTLSIENMPADAASVGDAVNELKSGMIHISWSDGDGISTASTITIGKYRNLERNTLTTDAKCAVSSALYASSRRAVTFTDANYEFAVIAYNNSPVSSANMIGGYGWYPANTIVILPPEAFIFVYQVRKASAIDSSEEDAIKNGLKTYVPTDSTLSVSGKSADAKATGDALDALRLIPARTVLAIGDSICRGERNDRKGFVGDLGLEYVNAGVSGATISTVRDTTTHWIENQLTAQTGNFDVVIMQGGINDYIYDATLGTMSAIPVRKEDSAFSSLDTTTVIGALEHLFATCINKYPNADRFFLISHKTREYAWTAGDGGWTQEQLHDAIVACCRLYNVGVIDVYAESPIDTHYTEYVSPTTWNNDHSVGDTEWVDNDRVHPLEFGYLHGYIPLIRKALIATSSKE